MAGGRGSVAQTCRTRSQTGELSVAFKAVRAITDAAGQAEGPGAWVAPTWQNHPAI